MVWQKCLPPQLQTLYDIYEFKHASTILKIDFPNEFNEVCDALMAFRFTEAEIKKPGGSETDIPKAFSSILRPQGWVERQLKAEMLVDGQPFRHDTHKVDYIKGRVAFDLEWNSKDQTFDRDLFAFRTFFEYDVISVAILVTRSNELDPYFASLGSYIDKYKTKREYKAKYGSSTTHMGKLLPRLNAGRNGGCPVLVFGITTRLLAP